MGKQRIRFEKWFPTRKPRAPELEANLLAIADAFDSARERGTLNSEQLALIVDGASSEKALLWMTSVDILGALSKDWPEAVEAIVAMSKDRNSQVRFNAICCLQVGIPNDAINSILKAGLIDKSSQVRWKAADQAEKLDKVDFIPDLTAAFAAEKNKKTREAIEHHLLLLRDGYILQSQEDGSFFVTARTKGGCTGRGVTAEELKTKGVNMIADEIRARSNRLMGEG
jgi:hypothetical protein